MTAKGTVFAAAVVSLLVIGSLVLVQSEHRDAGHYGFLDAPRVDERRGVQAAHVATHYAFALGPVVSVGGTVRISAIAIQSAVNVRVVAAYVVIPGRSDLFIGMAVGDVRARFPTMRFVPAEGAVLPPGERRVVVLEVSPQGLGPAEFSSVKISYTVGKVSRTLRLPVGADLDVTEFGPDARERDPGN